uniref:laccase n=1 Tax=Rigidoporus microporus TaxID=219653 RepID=E0W6S1_9APHY|nr:laccase [Rigidoporus microporus]
MPSFSTLSAFVTVALALGAFASVGPVADIPIVNANLSPDGFTRTTVLAGGTFPGPLIVGNKGDNFKLNVVDQLTDANQLKTTTIHWHGFFQHGTNWADGPAFVNQCPIASGNSFLYDFSAADQAGTFWYHSHLSTQYCDGLRGAFVVYDPSDPNASLYDVDNESTVITLADWYHTLARLGARFPTPDSTLINGLGRFAGGPASDLSVITVESGKRYRFRLVSISCDPNYTFSIDGHDMTIIEVNGINHDALSVDSIQIFAGQRYSFVLNANQAVGNYWIRANPNIGTRGFSGGINSAILRYVGADAVEPTTSQGTSTKPLVETNLHPSQNPGAVGSPTPGGVDLALNLALGFAGGSFTINGATFTSPTVPVLLQILSGAQSATDLLPSGSVFTLPGDSTIEISMPAGVAGGPHPFHLHGHAFDVVRASGSSTYNYANPVRRDVVSLGAAGDNVTIRFKTDNPGPWFLHCHIDWHLEAGLAIVFAEDTPNTAAINPVPQAWSDLCPIYNALAESDH